MRGGGGNDQEVVARDVGSVWEMWLKSYSLNFIVLMC